MLLFSLYLLLSASAQPTKADEDFFKNFEARRKAMIGKPFPAFSAKSGDSTISNEDFEGNVVFANFWFEACAPCVAEFEGLNELYKKVKDSAGFAFVAFTYETPDKCKEVQVKYGLQYPVVSISVEECYRLNGGFGFPANVILDKKGTIRFFECGGSTNKRQATEHLMTAVHPKIIETFQNN